MPGVGGGLGQSFVPRNLFHLHICLSQAQDDTLVEFSWKFFGVVFLDLEVPLMKNVSETITLPGLVDKQLQAA